jgi:CDP-diacylglycerol--glycerol-3-phosphate 3-phosphatidyltransferase
MSYRLVPYLLVWFRLIAGVALVGLSWTFGESTRFVCAGLLALGVLSDIFDGVIARRLGSATEGLRTFDSRVDLVFWLCITAAVIHMHPALFGSVWPMIAVLGAMELTTHLVSFARFRREASPHHLLSKLFGLGLWALLTQMLLTGRGDWLQGAVFLLGVTSQLEALAITLLLRTWRTDVRGLRHALSLRRGEAATADLLQRTSARAAAGSARP